MGRLSQIVLLISLIFLLTGCPLKDWIKSEEDNVGVEEFKRITKSLNTNSDKDKLEHLNQHPDITVLFQRLADYRAAKGKEKNVLFKKAELDFKQNPTLVDALFLSMIQVTIPRKRNSLAVHSSYMNAVDLSKAEPGLLEIRKVFTSLEIVSNEKQRLRKKLKQYQADNSKQKAIVKELTAQINALKNIEESIYERELFSGVQE